MKSKSIYKVNLEVIYPTHEQVARSYATGYRHFEVLNYRKEIREQSLLMKYWRRKLLKDKFFIEIWK
jgi:hypothetical protein